MIINCSSIVGGITNSYDVRRYWYCEVGFSVGKPSLDDNNRAGRMIAIESYSTTGVSILVIKQYCRFVDADCYQYDMNGLS